MKEKNDQYNRNYYENVLFRSASNSQRNQNGLNELLRYVQSGRLFEIGCGKGEFLRLASRYFDVRGLDVSRYATRSAATSIISRVRYGDIEQENLAREEFDAVAAFNVLEHLQNPSVVVSKIYSSLCRGGVLIGSVPLNHGPFGRILTTITNIVDRTHVSTYEPGRWRLLFQDTGFSQVRLFGEVMLGKNYNLYLRHSLWPYLSFNLMFVCVK